ncbi:zinc ribbon domain-containing protein [Candidatus Wolfebacteria bacterium]|nr:zinc ribbon domain-containing protein [Candidatus Wolfebacteria bacterium]
MENTSEILCPLCQSAISASANFCSQCGKKIKDPPLSTSIQKQIFIYCVSFFLAPFGLGYAFKYFGQPDKKSRIIGIVALALTIIAIALMIFVSKAFMDLLYGQFNTLNF